MPIDPNLGSSRVWDFISRPGRGLRSLQLALGGKGVLGSGPSLGRGSVAPEPQVYVV